MYSTRAWKTLINCANGGWTTEKIHVKIHVSQYGFSNVAFDFIGRNWPWYSLRGVHIRITWFSLYGIRMSLFSLYGVRMPLFHYMVIQPIVLGMALLWAAMDSVLSQVPLLWRQNDMTVIVSRNTRGRERDTDNALTTRILGDYKLSIDRFLYDSMRYVTHFCEITQKKLRYAIVG